MSEKKKTPATGRGVHPLPARGKGNPAPGGKGKPSAAGLNKNPVSGGTSKPSSVGEEGLSKPSNSLFEAKKPWLNVCDAAAGDVPLSTPPEDRKPETEKRTGWKTIRIFVSSTFKDFHHEREVLVKKVFPDLRTWCQKQRLHLVECDLRWGVPYGSPTETTLRTCLEEIDRCIEENKMPYFINMTSERVGWIPGDKEVPGTVDEKYRWVYGMSVTEMEIVHGAYRKENPNALFLMRDDSFVELIPDPDTKKEFRDHEAEDKAKFKLPVLKEKIKERFPPGRVIKYKCDFKEIHPTTKKVVLKLEEGIEEKILEFFKERILQQYPRALEKVYDDPLDRETEQHEAFMKSRVDFIFGRESIIEELLEFTKGSENNKPLVLVGGHGAGKTSILAKVVDTLCQQAADPKIEGGGKKVIYHFVGAVPGSTSLTTMLKRLLKILGMEERDSGDLMTLKQSCCSALANPNTKPLVFIVDAVNQLDEDMEAEFTWLPSKLSPTVKVVLSMIDGSHHHIALKTRETAPKEMSVPPFTMTVRKQIIGKYLERHNKQLSTDQMVAVLEKSDQPSSNNPLWLNVACEELRVWGLFRELDAKIKMLPNNLLGLLEHVIIRFEDELEEDASLMKATLCLLETSRAGLCEVEILEVLGDESSLLPPITLTAQPSGRLFKPSGNVAALRWHNVYRNLRSFLRPYGDSGEGRLDFYHRSLSKVVRKRYFHANDQYHPDESLCRWWHRKLADFFEYSTLHERKVEEYPHHLIAIADAERLQSFLLDWQTFDSLYDQDCSTLLLKFWRGVESDESYSQMAKEYMRHLLKFLHDDSFTETEKYTRTVRVATVLLQAHKLTEALELGQKAEVIVEKGSALPSDCMVEVFQLFAEINSQKVSAFARVGKGQEPYIKECLKYNDKTVELLRRGEDKDLKKHQKHQKRLGRQLLRRAKARSSLVDLIGVKKGDANRGLKDVDEAMVIFKKLNDNSLIAEALLQKADLMNLEIEKAYEYYKEALDLCLKTNGKFHILSSRIFKNTGICAEDIGNALKAKEKEKKRKYREDAYIYYKEYYEVNIEIFGRNHPKTKTAESYITEYEDIAEAMGHSFDFLGPKQQ